VTGGQQGKLGVSGFNFDMKKFIYSKCTQCAMYFVEPFFKKQTDRYKSYWQSLQALITITGRFSLRHETEQRALVFFAQQNKR